MIVAAMSYVPSGTESVSQLVAADQLSAPDVGAPAAGPTVKAPAGPEIRHWTEPRPLPLVASTWRRTVPDSTFACAGRLRTRCGVSVAGNHVAALESDRPPTRPDWEMAATRYEYLCPAVPETSRSPVSDVAAR